MKLTNQISNSRLLQCRPFGLVSKVLLLSALFLYSPSLQSQKAIGLGVGFSTHRLLYRNGDTRYRSFRSDFEYTPQFSARWVRDEKNILELNYYQRQGNIYASSGGLGGGTTHELEMDLSYLALSYKWRSFLAWKRKLYLNLGAYLGVPLRKQVRYEKRSWFVQPSMSPNSYSVTTDPSEVLYGVDGGLLLELGFRLPISTGMDLFLEAGSRIGFSGRLDFNQSQITPGFLVGVDYYLIP